MELTQKQRQSLAQKKKANGCLDHYCAMWLYESPMPPEALNNFKYILSVDSETLKHIFIMGHKLYVLDPKQKLYAKTERNGWSISPWSGSKKPRKKLGLDK